MIQAFNISVYTGPDGLIPSWEIEMLRQLQQEGLADRFRFFTAPGPEAEKSPLLYRLFGRLEKSWFNKLPDSLQLIPVSRFFPEPDVRNQGDKDTDLIILSSLVHPFFTPPHIPAMGIWQTLPGGIAGEKDPAFWPVMNNSEVLHNTLSVQFPGSTRPLLVYDGYTSIVPFSVRNSHILQASKAAGYLCWRLKELRQNGLAAFKEKYEQQSAAARQTAKQKKPGNGQMAFLFFRNIFRYAAYRAKNWFPSASFRLFYKKDSYSGQAPDIRSFTTLKAPPGFFWADPFVIKEGAVAYIFFEEFDYRKNKGHISLIRIDENGNRTDRAIVLEKPHHLAYPFVFRYKGDFYMLPDTSAERCVELFKATAFPGTWEPVKKLLSGLVLIDPTLLFENGKWWLFGTAAGQELTSTNDQLLLYYSDDLLEGDWTPHPQNPVVTDIAGCRPAGTIIRFEGQLYRPAQNNASRQYGYGLTMKRITRLTETDYEEETTWALLPEQTPRLKAIHTLNCDGDCIVTDGIVR